MKAAAATQNKAWANEIISVEGHNADGFLVNVDYDEVIRPETTVETLSGLRPAFNPKGGTVTAGNSSAISDGAAALLLMSREKAD
jgi:acetyl-CoA acyltransferase